MDQKEDDLFGYTVHSHWLTQQHLTQLLTQFFQGIRFGHNSFKAVLIIPGYARVFGIAAGDNPFDARVYRHQFLNGFKYERWFRHRFVILRILFRRALLLLSDRWISPAPCLLDFPCFWLNSRDQKFYRIPRPQCRCLDR